MDVKTVENGTETTDINEKPKVCESKEKDDDNSVETESKIWESGKIEDKDFPEAAEKESVEEVDSKTENDSLDQINGLSPKEDTPTVHLENGGSSPPTKEQSHKKKKPLLHKFGSLLKKKSSSNPK